MQLLTSPKRLLVEGGRSDGDWMAGQRPTIAILADGLNRFRRRLRELKVLHLPTASGDSDEKIERVEMDFGLSDAHVDHLLLFRREMSAAEMEQSILTSDVVYVSGGNTANALAVWRRHGVDRLLRKAYRRGVILSGTSAGAMCWFEGGVTDSFGERSLMFDGLALERGLVFPHFDPDVDSWQSFEAGAAEDIRDPLARRYSLPNGSALLLEDGTVHSGFRTVGSDVPERDGVQIECETLWETEARDARTALSRFPLSRRRAS